MYLDTTAFRTLALAHLFTHFAAPLDLREEPPLSRGGLTVRILSRGVDSSGKRSVTSELPESLFTRLLSLARAFGPVRIVEVQRHTVDAPLDRPPIDDVTRAKVRRLLAARGFLRVTK